ncbi:hypothetical protein CGC59_06365 [Capnocytophaga sputigena]|uniref:Uncharacterized protein n=2 Tax=Capnocytophaga sputigena TaxID=1019 RepID=A0A250F2F1_CAPSP|nr:hypothetical protein CGC59_06365 [Capnocytophaga sputigena]
MYILLHRQNDRTSNNIKHINSMKALELKDLKAGNIYKRVDKNYYTEYSAYVEVISEGLRVYCNYFFIMYNEQGEVAYFYVNKNCQLKEIQTLYARYELSTEKEFKAALKMIKDSLTF